MDALIRQKRMRYGRGEEDSKQRPSTSVDRSPSKFLQKTPSFRGEKKKDQSWFKKSFSRRGPDDESGNEVEYAVSVAAAALAVSSLENSSVTDNQKSIQGPKASLAKVKSKIEDTTAMQQPVSKRLLGEASTKSSKGPDRIVPINDVTQEKMPEKAFSPTPSIRRTATDDDKRLKEGPSRRKQDDEAPKFKRPPAKQPSVQAAVSENQSSTRKDETEADIWEKAKMEKIKHKYDKLIGTITSWEENKKKKAQHRKARAEAESGPKRAKSMQYYVDMMRRIDEIADAAKEKAKKKRRREESEVREKANKIRKTGKQPSTCLCF